MNMWFVKIGTQIIGPLTRGKLDEMIRSGEVGPAALTMSEDGTEFKPLQQIPEFYPHFHQPPPPPPSPPPPPPPPEPIPVRPVYAPAVQGPEPIEEPFFPENAKKRPDPLIIALIVVITLLALAIGAGAIMLLLAKGGQDANLADATSASGQQTDAGTGDADEPSDIVFDRTEYNLMRRDCGGFLDESGDSLYVVGTDLQSIYRLDLAATRRVLMTETPYPVCYLNASGDYLYYLADSALYRIPLEGGTPEELAGAGSMDSLQILDGIAMVTDEDNVYLMDEELRRTEVVLANSVSDALFFDGAWIYYYAKTGSRIERYNIQSGETHPLMGGVGQLMAATSDGLYDYDNTLKKLTLYNFDGTVIRDLLESDSLYGACAVAPGGYYMFIGKIADTVTGIDFYGDDNTVRSAFTPPEKGWCDFPCQTRHWALFQNVSLADDGETAVRIYYLLNLETGAVIPYE